MHVWLVIGVRPDELAPELAEDHREVLEIWTYPQGAHAAVLRLRRRAAAMRSRHTRWAKGDDSEWREVLEELRRRGGGVPLDIFNEIAARRGLDESPPLPIHERFEVELRELDVKMDLAGNGS